MSGQPASEGQLLHKWRIFSEKRVFDKLAGVNIRKKVRIRTYNNDKTLCKLEIKQKYGELQQKDSLIINAEDADGLLHGNFDVLKNYFDDTATSIRAYSIMRQGCYRPAVNIEYDRLAYKYQCMTHVSH